MDILDQNIKELLEASKNRVGKMKQEYINKAVMEYVAAFGDVEAEDLVEDLHGEHKELQITLEQAKWALKTIENE